MTIPSFFEPVATDLQLVERRLLEVVRQVDDPQLVRVLGQPFRGQGKRLRPALVLLAAGRDGSALKSAISFAAGEGHYYTPSREAYFQQIEGKTASLFAAAAEGGAILGGASEQVIKALRKYGLNLGMAFQIVDDILDFVGEEEELGKPRGTDLRQGTVTLPVICFLESNSEEGRSDLLRRILPGTGEDEELAMAIEMIGTSSAIRQAYAVAQQFVTQA